MATLLIDPVGARHGSDWRKPSRTRSSSSSRDFSPCQQQTRWLGHATSCSGGSRWPSFWLTTMARAPCNGHANLSGRDPSQATQTRRRRQRPPPTSMANVTHSPWGNESPLAGPRPPRHRLPARADPSLPPHDSARPTLLASTALYRRRRQRESQRKENATQMKLVDQINLGWQLLRRASQPNSGQISPLQGHKPRTTLEWELGEHGSDRSAEATREAKQILFEITAAG
jgi:hypothetical protein